MALGEVIARLAVNLTLETAAFENGANIAEKRLAKSQRTLQKFGDDMMGLGGKLSLALTAPLGAFGASAFNAASDAAELQSAFDQTFGSMSATMNKWAEDTGNALGRSTQEMQKAANTFGIFFNTAVDPAKAASMSQTFAQLAQDLGSFYNTDTETAIEKLRSGLSGESEPLRDFGVFLTEATVQAKAMELGLTGVGNELTEQEKIVARYNLILEATKNAQGDVARTSNGTANQIRAAQAAYEELQVVVGTKLLPVLTPLITKLAEAINWFVSLPEPVQNTALAVAAAAAAIGPLVVSIGGIASGVGAVLPLLAKLAPLFTGLAALMTGTVIPIIATLARSLAGLAIAGGPLTLLAAAVAAVVVVWKNWDTIGPILARLYNGVKTWLVDKLGRVWDWLQGKIKAVGRWFFELYDAVVGHSYIPDMVDGISDQMKRLNAEFVTPAAQATKAVGDQFEGLRDRIANLTNELFPEIAQREKFRQDMETIDQAEARGTYSPDQATEARNRVLQRSGAMNGVNDIIQQTFPELGQVANDNAGTIEAANVRIAKSFKDMAMDTISSLQNLASSIKGGGVLDILGSVINLGLQLGSLGAFGKTAQTNINKSSIPGYAVGTSSAQRGLALVGEKGPELVQMRGGERVYTNAQTRGMMGGGRTTNVFQGNLMTPEFWAMIQAGDAQAAGFGSMGAQVALARKTSRQIP